MKQLRAGKCKLWATDYVRLAVVCKRFVALDRLWNDQLWTVGR